MTVGELLDRLAAFPRDRPVVLEVRHNEADDLAQGGIIDLVEETRCCETSCVYIVGDEEETADEEDDEDGGEAEKGPRP